MPALRRRIVKQWDNVEDFTEAVRYGYILKKTRSVTHAGKTTMRMRLRDADGDEVAFPLSLVLEVTFHDMQK